jgi:hypothetical protein
MKLIGDKVSLQKEGYAIDLAYPTVKYIPEHAEADVASGKITWDDKSIWLVPGEVYIHPSGYQVSLQKHLSGKGWHIVGTCAEPTNCHKPSTVSGGGKSEISKLLSDMISFGQVHVVDLKQDLAFVDLVLKRDFSDRFSDGRPSKKILDPTRTLGSVVKMLTPSSRHSASFNTWLESIPPRIKSLVFLVKHVYQESWGSQWQEHITVERIDGHQGSAVHVVGKEVVSQCVRIGRTSGGQARKFMLRHDFVPAAKIQTEDDITASVVVPATSLQTGLSSETSNPSLKMSKNCELRLFQRPDDAIHRGADTQAEMDLAAGGNFMSNFEGVTKEKCTEIVRQACALDKFTKPMQQALRDFVDSSSGPSYVVSSSHFRIVDGKPTANPRYLQVRTDFEDRRKNHVAEISARLRRRLPLAVPVHFPVNSVLAGRRNNPPDSHNGVPIRPLSVFNPIHYQDLPELFAEFISSLTGKSPSTTGVGSEGALTKGPFNAVRFAADLNTTLVGMILGRYEGFSSAAGYIGQIKVDHDISLLIPEIWCRMSEPEKSADWLVKHKFLEPVKDFEANGAMVLGSRLGFRITAEFVHEFLGRVFESPSEVFDESLLRPETQDFALYVDGINNIVKAHQKTAKSYIADGTIEDLVPPLQAVVKCMADMSSIGPDVRAQFSRDAMLQSEWYHKRLLTKQSQDIAHWRRGVAALKKTIAEDSEKAKAIDANSRLSFAENMLEKVSHSAHLKSLIGTAGSDPSLLDVIVEEGARAGA